MSEPDLITRTLQAFDRIRDEWCLVPPPLEYRIHPDDFEEFKKIVKIESTDRDITFGGLRIVLDERAQRLPRRQS